MPIDRGQKMDSSAKRLSAGDQEFAQLTGSKDVKGVIDKRKRKKTGVIDKRKIKKTGKGLGEVVIEIPWEVYVYVQKALAFREKLKNKKDDKDSELQLSHAEHMIGFFANCFKEEMPRGWKYDPATASNLVSTNPAIDRNECPTPTKSGPDSHDHVERRGGCNSPQLDPNKELPDTEGIPLNEEEMKIWLKFKELDKKTPEVDGIDLRDPKKDRRPIEVDNPFVSLIANFAIAAFNQAIEMLVKKGQHDNLHDFELMECTYIKMTPLYYFYITIEAIEERKLGVYETKVVFRSDKCHKSLSYFELTDRKPRGTKKIPRPYQRTQPGTWSDPEEYFFSGLQRRSKGVTCRVYDFYSPWGWDGP